jgi:hypothetical protein
MRSLFNAIFCGLIISSCGILDKDKDHDDGNNDDRQTPPQSSQPTNQADKSVGLIASSDQLPPCDGSKDAKIFYIKDTDEFKACSDGVWETLDLRGPAGPTGPTGPAGEAGPTGASGGGLYVYDSNDIQIGFFSGRGLFAGLYYINIDGKSAQFNFSSGEVYTSYNYTHTQDGIKKLGQGYCVFASSDCTGDCYMMTTSDFETLYPSLIATPSKLYKIEGTEAPVPAFEVNSYYLYEECTISSFSGTVYGPITSLAILPAGATYPLNGPLYIAP